ncbi:hypothetical protein [Pseudomonas sp. Kh13]|uniref:hypothetical protein n=1 Tax=Pseudomonas sp. Kh13 TaxID=2093744 RepID=UPI0011827C39|nr:hypothetical protein [Pseudomonas sp. Kh13]
MNFQPTSSATAAATSQQLADLLALTPSALSRHPELPQAHLVHTGRQGKPQHAFGLDLLAAFAYDQTAHLTEAECRLRLALAGRTEPSRTTKRSPAKPGRFYLRDNGDGTHEMVPILEPSELSFDEQVELRAAVTEKQP